MKAIVAMDLNRVIGNKGKMPWHISDDFKFFKEMTTSPETGGYLIMGRTTYDTVGSLPGRFTYVITSRSPTLIDSNVKHIYSKEVPDLICVLNSLNVFHKTWVCGGAKTYKLLLPECTEVYATIVLDEYEGDAYMPHFEDQFPNSEILRETNKFWIVRYWK